MTNLEWFNEIGMIAENEVWTKTPNLKGQIGVNLVIALRDNDFKKYSEKGFGWLLEEHKEPIKLKQWEKDLLETIDYQDAIFSFYVYLRDMKKRGYFEWITDTNMSVKEILENCEVEDR